VKTMDLKVMIADDDTGMRMVLKKAISKIEGFITVGEAEDGESALQLYELERPQIVFLDVEMPVVNGVECAKRIADIDPKAFIIFATAHEEYMPDAFEVYAFDYIVKPFKIERLHQTLLKIKATTAESSNGRGSIKISGVKNPGKLMIRNKEGISLLNLEDIILIQREDRSTVIYTVEGRFPTSEGLSDLEERLDKAIFFRCHKSYIINLSAVSKIFPYGRWTFIIKLKGTDKDALLTYDKYEELEKLFY